MALAPTTFVLVHGAWHGGWCWRRVVDLLTAKGHRAFAPTLTGLGERSHLMRAGINVGTHATDVVNVIKWERLSDVVLCGHSYGGMVVSAVAEQAADKIASIVFLDAFVPENGDSMADLTSQVVRDNLRPRPSAATSACRGGRRRRSWSTRRTGRGWIRSPARSRSPP